MGLLTEILKLKKQVKHLVAERDLLKRALRLASQEDEEFETGTPWEETYNDYIKRAKEQPC
jgi:hypothetical protein